MFFAMFENLLDHGFALDIHPADHGIVNGRASASEFAVFNVITALPHDLFAGMVAVPCPPSQCSTAFGAKQHARQGITVLIFVFCFFIVAFGLGPERYLTLRFLPDFAGDDGLMAVLKIKAVDFPMVHALLFAQMVLAEGFLQFGVPFVFLGPQDAQDCAGMPHAAGNGFYAFCV